MTDSTYQPSADTLFWIGEFKASCAIAEERRQVIDLQAATNAGLRDGIEAKGALIDELTATVHRLNTIIDAHVDKHPDLIGISYEDQD